jgi:hypothetical protein
MLPSFKKELLKLWEPWRWRNFRKVLAFYAPVFVLGGSALAFLANYLR